MDFDIANKQAPISDFASASFRDGIGWSDVFAFPVGDSIFVDEDAFCAAGGGF